MKNINAKQVLNKPKKNKNVSRCVEVLLVSVLMLMILFPGVDAKFSIMTHPDPRMIPDMKSLPIPSGASNGVVIHGGGTTVMIAQHPAGPEPIGHTKITVSGYEPKSKQNIHVNDDRGKTVTVGRTHSLLGKGEKITIKPKMSGGKVTITNNGDGKVTIEMDDGKENKIKINVDVKEGGPTDINIEAKKGKETISQDKYSKKLPKKMEESN